MPKFKYFMCFLSLILSNLKETQANNKNVAKLSTGLSIHKRAASNNTVNIPTNIRVPPTIILGEDFYLNVFILNPTIMPATVKAVLVNDENNFKTLNEVVQSVRVPRKFKRELNFHLSAKRIGQFAIPIKVTVNENNYTANVTMDVLPEGYPMFNNKPVALDLIGKSRFRKMGFELTFKIDVPEDSIEGSTSIQFTCTGDPMGLVLEHLDQLIPFPTGCGEQTMVTLVPVILLAKYLQSIEKLTPELMGQLTEFMEMSYINELQFKRNDSSFSVWGNKDTRGSTWLTAFVVKTLVQAMDFIEIDTEVVERALRFLANVQNYDGSFSEIGHGIHQLHGELQGKSNEKLALSAYTVIALLDIMDIEIARDNRNESMVFDLETIFNRPLTKPISYLERSLAEDTDIYTLSIVAYALSRAESDKAVEAFKIISKKFTAEGDSIFWEVVPQNGDTNCKNCEYATHPLNIEATAYVLLTYTTLGEYDEALPIYHWLLSKRNANGGFTSTQDTCVGLEAIATYALHQPKTTDFKLKVSYDETVPPVGIEINERKMMETRTVVIPAHVREVKVTGEGLGIPLAQVTWNYFTLGKNATPSEDFKLSVNPKLSKNSQLNLDICVSYMGSNSEGSNMAIVEVHMPSGYIAESANLPSAKIHPNILPIELENNGNIVQIYFDFISKKNECFRILGAQETKVFNLKPTYVLVYDYYDPIKRHQVFYSYPN